MLIKGFIWTVQLLFLSWNTSASKYCFSYFYFPGFYSSNMTKRDNISCLILGVGKLNAIIHLGLITCIHISFPWLDSEIDDFRSLAVLYRARILFSGLFSTVAFWMFPGPSLQVSNSQALNYSPREAQQNVVLLRLVNLHLLEITLSFHHTEFGFF